MSVVLEEKWPVFGRHELAAGWLRMWADLGQAPRTIDAYARGLAEYLRVCEREGVDPVTANRAHVAVFVRELTSRNRYLANVKLEEFWALIQGSSTATKRQRERTEWLTGNLARLPVPAIIAFELHLTAQRKRVDTWLMWGAAWIIMQGWCSDDGFFYFQPWLVGLGHQTFERVAGNPDSLADTPQIHRLAGRGRSDWSDDEWPEWELLNYVARNAYQRATGEEDGLDNALEAQGLHRIYDAAPEDDPWNYDDPGQRLARLPRLTALLG